MANPPEIERKMYRTLSSYGWSHGNVEGMEGVPIARDVQGAREAREVRQLPSTDALGEMTERVRLERVETLKSAAYTAEPQSGADIAGVATYPPHPAVARPVQPVYPAYPVSSVSPVLPPSSATPPARPFPPPSSTVQPGQSGQPGGTSGSAGSAGPIGPMEPVGPVPARRVTGAIAPPQSPQPPLLSQLSPVFPASPVSPMTQMTQMTPLSPVHAHMAGPGVMTPPQPMQLSPQSPPVSPAFPVTPATPVSGMRMTAQPPFYSPETGTGAPPAMAHVPPAWSRRRPPWYARSSRLLAVLLLLAVIVPSLPTVIETVNAFTMYSYARSGLQHVNALKAILGGSGAGGVGKGHLSLQVDRLRRAEQEMSAAHDDFQRLRDLLGRDALVQVTSALALRQVTSARALSQMGVDGTEIGGKLLQTAVVVMPTFQSSALAANVQTPLLTPALMDMVGTDLDYALPRLDDMTRQARSVSLDALPVSGQQKALLGQILPLLPQALADARQLQNLLSPLSWLLGVGQPRTILVQTMDRAELRPTGGFTGQFGELHINGGRVGKFSLQNVGLFEENNPNAPTNGQLAPQPYRSWWPIPNWGLRDSNLSADFPTSARIAIEEYKFEFGRQVDGVVLFSPFLISRVLLATGPLVIPAYGETITAQNLESRLHYYQLDNVGIRKEEIVEHVPDSPQAPALARKLFTAKVEQMLEEKLRHASPAVLLAVAGEMLQALKTRDLQVYVTNPQVESLLAQYGDAAEVDRSTAHDGLFVVQANVSASKASQYVRTMLHDTVSLDSKGGATHVLQLRLVYNQVGQVYGLDTYRDYVRVYVPPTATFLWGDGFDTGNPLCFQHCPTYDIYGNGDLLCPAGLAAAGEATTMLNNPYNLQFHPLDTVGPPTAMVSDEPQRAMYGGWVVIPKNCTMTVSLSWYVPPMGHGPYSLLVQRQSSTFPELDLTLLPTPGACPALKTAGRHYDLVLSGTDHLFSLAPAPAPTRRQGAGGQGMAVDCSPQPGV